MSTEYGNRLRLAMAHAKLNQKQLIAETGIKQSSVSSAMNRATGSSDTPIYARACKVDSHWLATGEGEMVLKQNQALSPVDIAPTAINKIASMADCLQFLATYLEALDAGDRAEALRMVARLGNEPEKHASVARSIEGMASAAFARAHQKAA